MSLSTPRVSLDSLIPEDIFIGTSLILRKAEHFLFGLRPPHLEGTNQIIEATGIGGGLEKEDSSYWMGAVREVREEIDCAIQLLGNEKTLVVRGADDVQMIELSSPEKPAALVLRNHQTPIRQPWSLENSGTVCILVFAAEIIGVPRPAMELPWLLWIRPEQVLACTERDIPIKRLLAEGAKLIASASVKPAENSLIRMTIQIN